MAKWKFLWGGFPLGSALLPTDPCVTHHMAACLVSYRQVGSMEPVHSRQHTGEDQPSKWSVMFAQVDSPHEAGHIRGSNNTWKGVSSRSLVLVTCDSRQRQSYRDLPAQCLTFNPYSLNAMKRTHAEMPKVIKIAEIHFWPKKISTKKWPKNDQKLTKIAQKLPKMAKKWPKIAQKLP